MSGSGRTNRQAINARRAVLFLIAFLVISLTTEMVSLARSPVPLSNAPCTVSEIGRERLSVDGFGPGYVEPETIASGEGRTLLLGSPSYFWETKESAAEAQTNRWFGVLLPPFESAQAIPPPIRGASLGMARAASIGPDTWGVVFAEMSADYANRRVRALWFGVLNGTTWTAMERIPLPPQGDIAWLRASRVIAGGGGLTFAVPVTFDNGTSDVAVFRLIDGRWTYELLGNRTGVYVDIGYTTRDELTLAVVRADQATPVDRNSLFLQTEIGNQSTSRKLASGVLEPNHDPRMMLDGERIHITWWSEVGDRREARAILDAATPMQHAILVDSSVTQVEPIALGGGVGWVVDHVNVESGEHHLRVLQSVGGEVVRIGSFAYPFQGPFDVLSGSSAELSLVGPFLAERGSDLVAADTILVALSLRFALNCGRD